MKGSKVGLKIFVGLVAFIAVIAIGAFIWYNWVVSANDKEYSSEPEVLSVQNSDKKALVVFQPSRTNFTSDMAHQIAKALNDNGYEVTINKPGKELSTDESKYSVLVFGTPVYVKEHSPVLEEYMKSVNSYSQKKILLFSTGMEEEKSELNKLEGFLKGEKAALKIKFLSDNKDKNNDLAYEAGTKLANE